MGKKNINSFAKDGAQVKGRSIKHRKTIGALSLFEWNYYLHDHLGNTRVVLDEQGDVKEYYDYHPFGKIMPGRSLVSGEQPATFKYTGKELDDENALEWYYFGARYYDAEIGRWLVVDPLGQGYSPYVYCQNNPTIRIDPDGQKDKKAMREAVKRTSLGAISWLGGVGACYASAQTGIYLIGLKGFGLMTIGASEFAFGIADYRLAMKTPDGMKAVAYGTLVNYVSAEFGMGKVGQNVLDLFANIALGGTDIPKNLYSLSTIQNVQAFLDTGQITEEVKEIIQMLYEEEQLRTQEENRRKKEEEEKRKEEAKKKEDDQNE